MTWQLCCNGIAGTALPLLVPEDRLQCHYRDSGSFLQLATGFCIGSPKDIVPRRAKNSDKPESLHFLKCRATVLTAFLALPMDCGYSRDRSLTYVKRPKTQLRRSQRPIVCNNILYAKPCEDCFELLYDGLRGYQCSSATLM